MEKEREISLSCSGKVLAYEKHGGLERRIAVGFRVLKPRNFRTKANTKSMWEPGQAYSLEFNKCGIVE
jgi:hypothetical protein